MEIGTIRQININAEMQASYLDYAMSVIVARALPDVRDGLKPVHRRILYAMYDLGLTSDKPYKKSARIVGEVLGKYHPHGDAAVYEAMVRMAQDFSLRYPLVDGQGNFGSIDGDNAAAMRYTEARLAAISNEMLADIEKDTVDWNDNFDGTLKEPAVLPAALPNMLVNGASGIAVGMSTSVPPHNLGEVCNALAYLIDNYGRVDDVTIEDLVKFIPGPDFPTGGVVYRYQHEGRDGGSQPVDMIATAYASGKGRFVLQAKAHFEDMSRNRSRIVVTELPYQVNKANLLERIAELVRDGRLEGITDLRDESDRTGMRVSIELTRTVDPRGVLAELFRLTPLQSTFSVSLLALVDGEPRMLSLKRLLLHFLEHRQEVIMRRSRYELARARQRAHILEGLLRALDILDEIIALIRKSRSADTAKQNLIEQYKFTEVQAQAILDMQLRRLAALERRKLQDEYREVIALIRELEELLASPEKVLALIKQNLADLKAKYGDARRTQIADRVSGTLTALDVLPDQDVWVSLSGDGTLARYRQESGDGMGRDAEVLRGGAPGLLLSTNTRHDLYLFSAKGQAARVHAHQIPEAPGSHFADISGLGRRDRVVAMAAFPRSEGEEQKPPAYVVLGTVQGKVKRITDADLIAQAHTDPQVIGLDDGDELVWLDLSQGEGEILLATATGQVIRFAEEEVRATGLPAGGIGGIKLQKKDRVVAGMRLGRRPEGAMAANQLVTEPEALALVTAAGWAKRVPLSDFPAQGRNGQGVIGAKLSARSGDLAAATLVPRAGLMVCLFDKGLSRVVAVADVPELGRPAQGKPMAALAVGEPVHEIYAVAERAGAGEGSPLSGGQRTNGKDKAAPGGSSNGAGRRASSRRGSVGSSASPAIPPKGTGSQSTATGEPGKVAGGKAAAPERASRGSKTVAKPVLADETAPVGRPAPPDATGKAEPTGRGAGKPATEAAAPAVRAPRRKAGDVTAALASAEATPPVPSQRVKGRARPEEQAGGEPASKTSGVPAEQPAQRPPKQKGGGTKAPEATPTTGRSRGKKGAPGTPASADQPALFEASVVPPEKRTKEKVAPKKTHGSREVPPAEAQKPAPGAKGRKQPEGTIPAPVVSGTGATEVVLAPATRETAGKTRGKTASEAVGAKPIAGVEPAPTPDQKGTRTRAGKTAGSAAAENPVTKSSGGKRAGNPANDVSRPAAEADAKPAGKTSKAPKAGSGSGTKGNKG